MKTSVTLPLQSNIEKKHIPTDKLIDKLNKERNYIWKSDSTQENAKSMGRKSGRKKEKKGNVERQNSSKKSNGSQESLQQDVKQDVKEPNPSRKALFASGK